MVNIEEQTKTWAGELAAALDAKEPGDTDVATHAKGQAGLGCETVDNHVTATKVASALQTSEVNDIGTQEEVDEDGENGAQDDEDGAGIKSSASQFPSIAQLRHLQQTLVYFPAAPEVLTYRGTVKLHGTNMAVTQPTTAAELVVQSRNRTLGPGADNLGSYGFVQQHHRAFQQLFATIRERSGAEPEEPVVMFGELAGKGVQSGVGISKVEKFYAVFCILVAGRRVDMAQYADVHCNQHRIFNIFQFGTFEIPISKADPMAMHAKIDELSEAVGSCCPAAQFFGVGGKGEGIVWTCPEIDSARLWFKSKCAAHTLMAHAKAPKVKAGPNAAQEYATEFADAFVTPARLQQGVQYLAEMGLGNSIPSFIKWVVQDTLKEEGGSLTPAQTRACTQTITRKAAVWYKEYLASSAAAAADTDA